LLSPPQCTAQGIDTTVVNCRTNDCLLLKSKLHLHFQIMLTGKSILNTYQQRKEAANKLHLKHLPETRSRILTALYNTDNTSKHDSK